MIPQEHDADGNPIGRSNKYLILDTCLCEVEFLGGEMFELAANIIADATYAQCDVNCNEYIFLEAFVNYRNNGSALSLDDQKVVIKG